MLCVDASWETLLFHIQLAAFWITIAALETLGYFPSYFNYGIDGQNVRQPRPPRKVLRKQKSTNASQLAGKDSPPPTSAGAKQFWFLFEQLSKSSYCVWVLNSSEAANTSVWLKREST